MFHVKHSSGNFVSQVKSTRFCVDEKMKVLEFEVHNKMFHVKHLSITNTKN